MVTRVGARERIEIQQVLPLIEAAAAHAAFMAGTRGKLVLRV